jgi:hypothetical protein
MNSQKKIAVFPPSRRAPVFSPGAEEDCAALTKPLTVAPEEAYEQDLFARIMSRARDQESSLRGLRLLSNELASPINPETRRNPAATCGEDMRGAPAKRNGQNVASRSDASGESEEDWASGMDSDGNPRWITLSVPERSPDAGRIAPDSPLPRSLAAPPATPRQTRGERQKSGGRRAPCAQQGKREGFSAAHAGARRIHPMLAFFRMLAVLAVLGVVWHFLSQRGWLPRLY